MLKYNSEEFARAAYDFDRFFKKAVGVTNCGEIRASAIALKEVFGRKSVQLLTDDGRFLDLSFPEKVLLPSSESAHVKVTGELPPAQQN
ncbi:MAG: hypothetical protein WBV25_07975 [Methylocella sp.]